jgi:hypothetical protein
MTAANEGAVRSKVARLVLPAREAENSVVTGPVEAAVRARSAPEAELPTPTERATSEIGAMTSDALILLFGPKKTRTAISWACLEGIPDYLRGRQWVRVGANRGVQGDQDALDGYLKGSSVAAWWVVDRVHFDCW